MDLAACDLTFAYVVYKLLKSKNVQFSSPNEYKKELQVHHRLTELLFPVEFAKFITAES